MICAIARRSHRRSRARRKPRALPALCKVEGDKPIDWGTLKGFGDDFSVVIGRRLAELMNLKVGDRLQLVSPVSVATPLGVMPRSAAVKVAAIFCTGMYDYDSNFIYAPLQDAQHMLNLGPNVTGIEVFVAGKGSTDATRRLLMQAVGSEGWVFDWFQANAGFFSAVVAQTNMIFLVLTMIVIVAAFNIVSSLVMLVRTKTADIAILRTMGASRAAIMRIFLLDGLAIGGAGTVLGVVLGLAFARNIEAIRQWLQRPSISCCSTRRSTCWPNCRRRSNGARSRASRPWRWSSLFWPRCIPRRARRASIRSRGCAVSERAPTVERWLAWRYLATRQREGFVSFIAMFSLIGVALGVGTLIAVLSVMGGFREQLLGRIIGMNGHVIVAARAVSCRPLPNCSPGSSRFPGSKQCDLPWNGRRWSRDMARPAGAASRRAARGSP